MSENLINDYLKEIHAVFTKGDAREESYYSRLENLIKSTADELHKSNIAVITLPRKTEGGNPDFRIWDGIDESFPEVEKKLHDKK